MPRRFSGRPERLPAEGSLGLSADAATPIAIVDGKPDGEAERLVWAMERSGWVQAKAARLLKSSVIERLNGCAAEAAFDAVFRRSPCGSGRFSSHLAPIAPTPVPGSFGGAPMLSKPWVQAV